MPQPLKEDAPLVVNPIAIRKRPKLAVLIATIIAQWALVERQQAYIFGLIWNYQAQAAIQIWFALRGTGPRETLLQRSLELTGNKEALDAYSNFTKALKGTRDGRNIAAHSIWGISPLHPRALVLCDVQEYAERDINAWHAHRYGIPATAKTLAIGPKPTNLVYSATDLRDISRRITKVIGFGKKLIFILDRQPKDYYQGLREMRRIWRGRSLRRA